MEQELKPLIIQGDGNIYYEVASDINNICRDDISSFAELVKSPEHIHTYSITPLAIWNAASSGIKLEYILSTLNKYSKYDVPQNIIRDISDWYSRYGILKLVTDPDNIKENNTLNSIPDFIYLISSNPAVLEEIKGIKAIQGFIDEDTGTCLKVNSLYRGRIKQALIRTGYPVEDFVGYVPGDKLRIKFREKLAGSGLEFSPRHYQLDAIESFYSSGKGGNGIVVLPSGAGKTMVGMGAMEKIEENTLIITPGTVALRQWINEIMDKLSIDRDLIGEYSGDTKEIKPITVTTYQVLTYSQRKHHDGDPDGHDHDESIEKQYPHMEIFRKMNWGLIVYDEVHLLPAPVFRITAEIQAKKRIGLTATLVREDHREDDVFSLIGPKKYDAPWKDLEKQGWIATARCVEVRAKIKDDGYRMKYATTPQRQKYRIAAENPEKVNIVSALISKLDKDDSMLIIGDYIDQLELIASRFNLPLITGKMKNSEREKIYSDFRKGKIRILVVSKVANYAIDLPDANVAIQISGTFGSRQEEAQRLGRLLRPKSKNNIATFYTVVTSDTIDETFSMKRQLFLTERGYKYEIMDGDEVI